MKFLELFSTSNPIQFQNQTMFVLSLVTCFVGWKIASKFGWASGLLFSWVVLDAVRVMWHQLSPYGFFTLTPGGYTLDRFREMSEASCRSVLTIGAMVVLFWNAKVKKWADFFTYLSVACSAFMVWNSSTLFYNSSMDASWLACCLPLFFRREFKWKFLSILVVAAIIKSGSSTAFMALAVCALCGLRKTPLFLFVPLVALMLWPIMPLNHDLFETSGRTRIWTEAWNYFQAHDGVTWWGFGTGTYSIHERSFHPEQLWIWLHNDFLQTGFEQGVIGLVLFGTVLGNALWKTRDTTWLFPSIVTFSFCLISQPLLRPILGSIYATFLLKEARSA